MILSRWSWEYVIIKEWGMTVYPCGCKHRYAENGKIDHGYKICKEHKKKYSGKSSDQMWLRVVGILNRQGNRIGDVKDD